MAIYEPRGVRLSADEWAVARASGFGATQGLGQRPALLVIDVNHKFVGDPEHSMLAAIEQWPTSCGARGWKAVPAIQRCLRQFRAAGYPVFYTTGDDRSSALSHGRWGGKNSRVQSPTGGAVDGNRIISEVAPVDSDVVLQKTKPSAFVGTPLLSYLVEARVDSLLLTGCTTSGCVRATAVDAFSCNFRVAIASDGVFDRFDTSHEISLFDLSLKYADVMPTTDCLKALRLDEVDGTAT